MTQRDAIRSTPSGHRLLDDEQLQSIHQAALRILETVGVRVYDDEIRKMLADAGCNLSDQDLVRMPPDIVEEALERAPSRVLIHDRLGRPAMDLGEHRTYYGTGSDLPNTLDLETGERRPSHLEDVARAARLADALPNLDFVMSMAQASNVDAATSDRKAFREMVVNSTKPIVYTAWDADGLADIVAMAERIAGGNDALAAHPFLIAYLEPTSPLQHLEEVMRKLIHAVDKGLPILYAPGPIDGASAPMTAAGSLALSTAEGLSGLAIAQLRRPGTPFIFGSGSGPLDMRTGVAAYFSPEFVRHCMAVAELAHYLYDLPAWGFSGCSDAKLPDAQAGAESALWILCTELSGANLVHDIGYIESGLTCSLEMMVVGDEIIGCSRRLLAPFDVSDETLALDIIEEVGPGGDYLSSPHTLKHFRECWYPSIFDRRTHHDWASSGGLAISEAARDRARRTLAEHEPEPIPEPVLQELNTIVEEADARHAEAR
jgi:trimethylamine--corrinoid protein Co-methyltransferase